MALSRTPKLKLILAAVVRVASTVFIATPQAQIAPLDVVQTWLTAFNAPTPTALKAFHDEHGGGATQPAIVTNHGRQ